MKGKTLIFLGNILTVVAVIATIWLIWDQEGKQLWNQHQSKRQFEAQLSATDTPTQMPNPTSTTEPTNTPLSLIATPLLPSPTPTPTPIPKGDYLLAIPSIDLYLIVHHVTPKEITEDPWGISKSVLDNFGIVDYPHLQFPGEPGLVSIAGHSDVSGNPFWNLGKVKKGDKIFITRPDKVKVEYLVYRTLTVVPDDPVFWETQYDRELRIVSCLIGSTERRIIVFANQIN